MHESFHAIPPTSLYHCIPIQLMPSGLLTHSAFMDSGANFWKDNISCCESLLRILQCFLPCKMHCIQEDDRDWGKLALTESDEAEIKAGEWQRTPKRSSILCNTGDESWNLQLDFSFTISHRPKLVKGKRKSISINIAGLSSAGCMYSGPRLGELAYL